MADSTAVAARRVATPARRVAGGLCLFIITAGTRDTLTQTRTHGFVLVMLMFLLVLDSVTSTPQCICQPRPCVYLKKGTYHTRLFRGTSTNGMKK